jgi:hypothetical protein
MSALDHVPPFDPKYATSRELQVLVALLPRVQEVAVAELLARVAARVRRREVAGDRASAERRRLRWEGSRRFPSSFAARKAARVRRSEVERARRDAARPPVPQAGVVEASIHDAPPELEPPPMVVSNVVPLRRALPRGGSAAALSPKVWRSEKSRRDRSAFGDLAGKVF